MKSIAVIGAGNWQMPTLSMSGQNQAIVTGAAVLYVTGSISLSGQSSITIAPGGSLKLYCNGSASLTGQGVANTTGSATNFFFYGMPILMGYFFLVVLLSICLAAAQDDSEMPAEEVGAFGPDSADLIMQDVFQAAKRLKRFMRLARRKGM